MVKRNPPFNRKARRTVPANPSEGAVGDRAKDYGRFLNPWVVIIGVAGAYYLYKQQRPT